MRLWHMLIITAIVIPVIVYFGLNPNETATIVIMILFVVGFVALRIWQLRRIARALRERSPGAPVPGTWGQPHEEGSEPPAEAPAYYWSGGKDRSS